MRRLLSLLVCIALACGCSLAAFAEEPARSGVTYEIFVGSFADSNGDGCGDLNGITDRLDYIASLGVSRIWLTPIHPSPSYHHYDVLDYCAVSPDFGTLEDFDRMVAACSERGIDVVLDLVVNHTSSEHPWFIEACEALRLGVDSPYISWYNFSQGHGSHAVAGTDWYYEGSFGDHMPDLNLDHPDVRAGIAAVMAFWQAHGVKGFRLDAVTSYYPSISDGREFVRWLCDTARQNDPGCYIVGEVWADTQLVLTVYGSGIDSLFCFPMADQNGPFIQGALKCKGASAARRVAEYQAQVREVSPASRDALFLTNHDMARVSGMLRLENEKMKAAAMLYLLMPGQPMVYYGEELGMTGSGRDENKRLPMLWSIDGDRMQCDPPADADQKQRLKTGVNEQNDDPNSLLNTYRTLIHLRTLAPELERGVMTAIETDMPAICAFTVQDGDGIVAVLVNVGTEDITLSSALLGFDRAELLGTVGQADWDNGCAVLSPVSCMLLRVQ